MVALNLQMFVKVSSEQGRKRRARGPAAGTRQVCHCTGGASALSLRTSVMDFPSLPCSVA